MKKIVLFSVCMVLVCSFLCGCLPNIMFIPSNDIIGEPQTFKKDGLTITLTDKFTEQESEVGFDAYFVADFCGVVVLKESFTLQEGLGEMSTEEYINNVIKRMVFGFMKERLIQAMRSRILIKDLMRFG